MQLPEKTEILSQKNLLTNSHYNYAATKFNWTNQSIEWYIAAENISTFYHTGIEIMEPYIKNSKTVLDIGCGIGSFSIKLANRGLNVIAIDKSSLAIDALAERIKLIGLNNLKALNISFEDFNIDQRYDIILISYMMGLVNIENIDKILEHINKHLILVLPMDDIKRDFSLYEFYMEEGIVVNTLKQRNYLNVLDILDKKNIKYETKIFKSDFGQPFETVEEAMNFINYYFNIAKENWDKLKDWLNRKLIIRNNMYYLSNIRESVMIII